MSPQETFCTLYSLFVACVGFCEPITKMYRMLLFLGEPFQWGFPSRHLHRSLLLSAHWSRCFCFSIFVLYFSSVSVFVSLYDLYIVSKKKKIQIFREILSDKFIRHWEVYSKYYLRGEGYPIRLLCFRETNS